MKKVKIAENLAGSSIVAGCMRIGKMTDSEADFYINTCLDSGIDFFDHADIYGRGACEEVFGRALKRKPGIRNKIIIQTKCGIVPGKMFDFSKEHILNSVDGSLKRLGTEKIEILLLHRPDTLMEPEEIAEAFDILKKSGKVKYFGVSNMNSMQIELLKKFVNYPVAINQVQFSAAFTGLIDSGFNVNMENDASINRNGYLLEYMRLNNMTVQAWSPYQMGFFDGTFIDSDKYPELNNTLQKYAGMYGVTKTGIASSFILRHPAKWQVVIGTIKPERIKEITAAADIILTREQWYDIYKSAGNILP